MMSVRGEQIKALLQEIDALRGLAKVVGEAEAARLKQLESGLEGVRKQLPMDDHEEFAPEMWDRWEEGQKGALSKSLALLRDAFAKVSDVDGPVDDRNLMYRAHASNWMTVVLTLLGVAGTVAVLLVIHYYWPESASRPSGGVPSEVAVLRMVMLMGALGGFVHLTSSLAKYVGNRQLLRSWIIYYLLMPLEGASLAPIIYVLLRVGVLSPAASGDGGTASLNLLGIYGFAGLTGLFSKQAIEMLADVFGTIFKKVQAKDPVEREGRPGAGEAGAPKPGGASP